MSAQASEDTRLKAIAREQGGAPETGSQKAQRILDRKYQLLKDDDPTATALGQIADGLTRLGNEMHAMNQSLLTLLRERR